MTKEIWSDDRKAAGLALFAKGLSATEVARKLGNTNRNAVLGMLHRAGALNESRAAVGRERALIAARAAKGAKTKTLNTDASPPGNLSLPKFSWEDPNAEPRRYGPQKTL